MTHGPASGASHVVADRLIGRRRAPRAGEVIHLICGPNTTSAAVLGVCDGMRHFPQSIKQSLIQWLTCMCLQSCACKHVLAINQFLRVARRSPARSTRGKWSRRGRRRGWRGQQEHCRTGERSSLTRKYPTANGHVEVGAVGGETSTSTAERAHVPA